MCSIYRRSAKQKSTGETRGDMQTNRTKSSILGGPKEGGKPTTPIVHSFVRSCLLGKTDEALG